MMLLWTVTLLALAQQVSQADVDSVLADARREIREFEQAGGRKDDPKHPVDKWVRTLWSLYDQGKGESAAANAASEAVHLLIHAGRFQVAYQRADLVPANDRAWDSLSGILVESVSLDNDSTYFFRKLPAIFAASTDPKTRAAVQWNLGRVWLGQKQREKARAAFQSAVEMAPESAAGRSAERQLYEMAHLGPGEPAPAFSAQAMDGARVALADSRGKPMLIAFWSSTCGACLAEVPTIRQLYWKYQARGLVLIGVSLDEDRTAAARAIERTGMFWPQVCDGKAEKGEIAKLYNVSGTPVIYVVDRAGVIADRLSGSEKLDELVFEVTNAGAAPRRTPRDTWQRPMKVAEALGIREGAAVADLGAGRGYFTFHLAAKVGAAGKVYAQDLDASELAAVRERAEREKLPQVQTIRGTPDDPKLPAASIDAILMSDTFHEFTNPSAMVAGIVRALRPGGRMGVLDRSAALGLRTGDYMSRHVLPQESLIEEAARGGLRLVSFDASFAVRPDGGSSYFAVFEKPRP